MEICNTSDVPADMKVPEAMAKYLIPPWPDMPKALTIGTEKAFARRQPYKYNWTDAPAP